MDEVSVVFGDRRVLNDVSLNVNEGEIVAIMGSSGGGKTTLLRCISGLLRPTSGTVIVDGIDVQKDPDEARRHMGMVFQSAALFDYMTVYDNVAFGLERRSKEPAKVRHDKVLASLELVGLSDAPDLMPNELSGGMKKRVGIARALVLEPRILLYDEPTTGLDPITTYTIDALIAHVRAETGVTSLIVSHDVSSVFRVADQIAFLEKGELSFTGDRSQFELSKNPAIHELVTKSQSTRFL